jgi:hypothetical protein
MREPGNTIAVFAEAMGKTAALTVKISGNSSAAGASGVL